MSTFTPARCSCGGTLAPTLTDSPTDGEDFICRRCGDEFSEELLRSGNEVYEGARIWRWWDSGAFGMEVQEFTVIRANKITATVETRTGDQFRLPYHQIVDYYDEEGD